MLKIIVINLSIIAVLAIGVLPFAVLMWDHPFLGGTSDIVVFSQHAKQTIDAQTISARGTHGFYTALQLFPFLFLQATAMTLMNALAPIVNFWILQHILSFLNTALFFILGRRCTRTIAGGLFAAWMSIVILDLPLWHNGGLPRFLSSFQYSWVFFVAILAFLQEHATRFAIWTNRFLGIILGAGTLFSHHHFGMLRIMMLLSAMTVCWVIPTRFLHIPRKTLLVPSIQALLATLTIWTVSNVSYLAFFIHDFGPEVFGR